MPAHCHLSAAATPGDFVMNPEGFFSGLPAAGPVCTELALVAVSGWAVDQVFRLVGLVVVIVGAASLAAVGLLKRPLWLFDLLFDFLQLL